MQVVTPQSDIYERLLSLGWSLKKVQMRSGMYIAKAVNETTGQDIERQGQTSEMAIAAVLQYAQRANSIRSFAARQKVASWSTDWLSQKEEIAKAYATMPVFDDKAVPAWQALAAESKVQADAIRQQITVEVVDDPEPYHSAQEMCEDIHRNKKFQVSRANAQHPVWSVEDNVNFRIVHDVIGHCQSGGDFSWRGENLACGVHFPLVTPLAREALFTDCIGQTAYRSAYKGFGPQKVGFLSQFLHPVQQTEGEHVWVPHGGIPNLSPSPNMSEGGEALNQAAGMSGVLGPEQQGQWVSPLYERDPAVMQGYEMKRSKSVSMNTAQDPNSDWNPSYQAPPVDTNNPNEDYIGLMEAAHNAKKIDTNWQNEDDGTQKRAIMNAFRVALLSPRKHIKWNAAHYQAIMHHDPSTKAVDLWHTLEDAREKHNGNLGYSEGSHLAYKKQLDYLAHELVHDDPSLTEAEARKEAKRIVFEKTKEFEAQLSAQYEGESKSDLWLYNQARKMTTAWMKENYNPLRGWSPGQMGIERAASQQELFQTDDDWKPMNDMSGFAAEDAKYGAFMGAHLDAIEKVGQHIGEIKDLAQKDLDEGGKGHVFRNGVMNMNLPGINPKVASFAWLLLAPRTSDLGIVDTHIMRGMRQFGDSPTVKDYYKLERMQKAAKDATGYSHVPLGMYHWGLWDQIRNPGEHSDHSALRALDPTPWDDPEAKWDAASTKKAGPWAGPIPFEDARAYMMEAATEFDNEFADQPHSQVPHIKPKDKPAAPLYVIP